LSNAFSMARAQAAQVIPVIFKFFFSIPITACLSLVISNTYPINR
jgi:hypothetical protein